MLLLVSFLSLSFCTQPLASKTTDDLQQVIVGVEELSLDHPFDQLKFRNCTPVSPGVFFRTFDDGKTVDGTYRKRACYYNSSLFADGEESAATKTKIFGLDRSTVKNYLGVVFFGIWSYGATNQKIHQVEVPVREVKNGAMFSDTDGKLKPRIIWKTGYEEQDPDSEDDGKKYTYKPCKGRHTEGVFIDYVKSYQKALWKYFLYASQSTAQKQNAKLDMMGFKFVSSNDACDSCYQSLHELQMEHREQLSDLVPISGGKPVSFVITVEASTFYHPQNDKHYGSSLFFYPARIKPLLRLGRANEEGHECCVVTTGAIDDEEDVKHDEGLLSLEEFDQPRFIFIKIDDGKQVKVKLS